MTCIKCKNETEKLAAIKDYCTAQITANNRSIKLYEMSRECSLDYADEIHALKISNGRFEKVLEIIGANEYTIIMV